MVLQSKTAAKHLCSKLPVMVPRKLGLMSKYITDRDCQKITEAFRNAFISKYPCSATEEDYYPLMKLVHQTVPCDKLAHRYTKVQREMFTLEDTLLGYMADDLSWCGDAGSYELNYQSCPHWKKDCSNNFVSVFWDLLSKRFAENACGVAQVVLNGSISNAFDRKSTFGRVEVHNLNPKKVHTLQAWVIRDLGKFPSDSCSGSSINDLRLIIKQRNIKFTCQDYYSLRIHLADEPVCVAEAVQYTSTCTTQETRWWKAEDAGEFSVIISTPEMGAFSSKVLK
eukprot:bmy_19094T0